MSRGALSIHQSHSLADGDYASETHSVMKPNPAILQILPHYGHESGGLSRADIARCIAAHNPVLDVDQVAAERCFLRLEFYAHGQRFNGTTPRIVVGLSLIHISEPTRRTPISYAVFCLKKQKEQKYKI